MTKGSSTYEIAYRRSVEKELRKIPKSTLTGIVSKIHGLARDPRPRGSVKLRGSDELYRVRHGDYRILYEIRDTDVLVIVVKRGHRRDIYA